MLENFKKRNEDFYHAVRAIQCHGIAGRRSASLGFAIRCALHSEAASFYITREYAYKQLHARRHRVPPREKSHRAAMWEEMEREVQRRMALHPDEDEWVALDYVLTCYRPSRFFISEDYAKKLMGRITRQRIARSRGSHPTLNFEAVPQP
jgi:hypothetical protein